jgi:hypothetical protein
VAQALVGQAVLGDAATLAVAATETVVAVSRFAVAVFIAAVAVTAVPFAPAQVTVGHADTQVITVFAIHGAASGAFLPLVVAFPAGIEPTRGTLRVGAAAVPAYARGHLFVRSLTSTVAGVFSAIRNLFVDGTVTVIVSAVAALVGSGVDLKGVVVAILAVATHPHAVAVGIFVEAAAVADRHARRLVGSGEVVNTIKAPRTGGQVGHARGSADSLSAGQFHAFCRRATLAVVLTGFTNASNRGGRARIVLGRRGLSVFLWDDGGRVHLCIGQQRVVVRGVLAGHSCRIAARRCQGQYCPQACPRKRQLHQSSPCEPWLRHGHLPLCAMFLENGGSILQFAFKQRGSHL